MSHAIRQDLSKLSKIIVFCLKTPSRGIYQSNEIIDKIKRIEPLQDEFSPEEPFDNDTTQIVPTKINLPARSLIEKDLQDLKNDYKQNQEDDFEQNENNPEQDSDEDDQPEELQGRQLRTKRKKTVKFDPSTFPQRRGFK